MLIQLICNILLKYILTYLTQKSTSSANDLKDRGTTSKNRKFFMNKQPYRMKNVQMTPDLILRYQLPQRKLEDVLASDLKTLEIFKKANQVNISNRRSLLIFPNIQWLEINSLNFQLVLCDSLVWLTSNWSNYIWI